MSIRKKYISYIIVSLLFINSGEYLNAHLSDITFILLGASGDLATRDLIPALFRLYRDKKLDNFAVIGAALPSIDKQHILNQSQQFVHEFNQQEWDAFAQAVHYVRVDFNVTEDFATLKNGIEQVEREHRLSGNRLIYCATSCNFFTGITKALVETGIIVKQDATDGKPWHRIAYEKPFGYDLITADAIEQCAMTLLDTAQVFHVDHFLMTQVMNHIPALRFNNRLLEHRWNKSHIKKVDILFNETLDIGARGKFYDAVGSLRDVVQNHMFQMLALVAMEEPEISDCVHFQHARAAVIRNTRIVNGFLGQYRGYTQEKGVLADSVTDTFSALQCTIDTPRWHGVPFFLITGKCLEKTEICIRVTFTTDDQVTFWIAPQPRIELTLHVDTTPLHVIYDYQIKDSYSTDTYKNIVVALCQNNRSVDVAYKEIWQAWQRIADIKQKNLPLYIYEKGSKGPTALELFNK